MRRGAYVGERLDRERYLDQFDAQAAPVVLLVKRVAKEGCDAQKRH